VVYEVDSGMAEPKTVAIKQMQLPQSIFDRCVLHDIFTEITCLEEFRLEPCVTDLYDYGVDKQNYYIVMKKYSGSLREWRSSQKTVMQDNISLYLSIYREILKCFKTIHSHSVTHYDIKCDNILIDFRSNDNFAITVGDFGECHMYTNEKDEF
jgi:serine/threonine protein kinase